MRWFDHNTWNFLCGNRIDLGVEILLPVTDNSGLVRIHHPATDPLLGIEHAPVLWFRSRNGLESHAFEVLLKALIMIRKIIARLMGDSSKASSFQTSDMDIPYLHASLTDQPQGKCLYSAEVMKGEQVIYKTSRLVSDPVFAVKEVLSIGDKLNVDLAVISGRQMDSDKSVEPDGSWSIKFSLQNKQTSYIRVGGTLETFQSFYSQVSLIDVMQNAIRHLNPNKFSKQGIA